MTYEKPYWGQPQIVERRAGLPIIDEMYWGGAADYDVILLLPNFLVIQKRKKIAQLTIQNPRKCRKVILKSHKYSLFRNFNIWRSLRWGGSAKYDIMTGRSGVKI